MILKFEKDYEDIPFQLFIFGEGSYEKQIIELAHKYKTIHYFGRQNLETIRRYTSNCNFILMPSTCLESFGLTALTGIARGLPVIGYAKGGTQPFIDPALDLSQTNGQNLPDKLYHLVHVLNKEEFFVNSLPTTEILKEYSKETRQSNIAYHL
jgi:glycogen synthase